MNLPSGLESELKWIDNNPQYYNNREHQEFVKTNIVIRYKCVKMCSDLDRVLGEVIMKTNKQIKAMLKTIDSGEGKHWVNVSHEKFFETFNIKGAELWESYTDCANGYARSVFSMHGRYETHKTVHRNGLNDFPDYYVKV